MNPMAFVSFVKRIFNLLTRVRVEREIQAEIEAHIELRVEDNIRAGMSPQEARGDARRRFGNSALIQERTFLEDSSLIFERLGSDIRYAFRQLAASPRFTMVAVASLAFGISGASTLYSVIQAVLIDPFPYRSADRIVHLHLYDQRATPRDLLLTGPQFLKFETFPDLEGAIAEDRFSEALTGEDLPEQVQVGKLSLNAFQFFGVPALIGREFGPSDSQQVAVLSYRFWKKHYQGRSQIIGSSIQLDHQDYTIIGVAPRRFTWNDQDIYIPLPYSADARRIAGVYARIGPGMTHPMMERKLQPLLDGFAQETPDNFPPKFKVHLVSLNEIAIGEFKNVLVILFIAVSALLLLACVNVAILLLARGEARQPEIAMRKALGASRLRIVGQLFAEGLALSLAGGLLGIFAAVAGIHLVSRYLPRGTFPTEAEIALNLPVLMFSAAISVLSGIGAALWPALRASRSPFRQEAGDIFRVVGQMHVRPDYMVFLAAQVAVTLVLLTASAAALRNLWQVLHADLGYDPQNLISVGLTLHDGAYPRWPDRVNYYERVRREIESQPGVVSVAIAEGPLPPVMLDSAPFSIVGEKSDSNEQVLPLGVSPQYFAAMGIRLLRGRVWSDSETVHAGHVALISEATRRRYWPHSDAIGQTFVLNHGIMTGNVWTLVAPGNAGQYQVIGVVADSPNQGLNEPVMPAVYLPYSMVAFDWFNLVIRIQADSTTLLHAIRQKVYGIDSAQAVGDATTAFDVLEEASLGRERFVAWLFTAFAFLALAFSTFGLYSILSYLVVRRKREFGVRLALGAQRRHIVRLVLSGTSLAITAGIGIGIIADFGCSFLFAQWAHGNTRDPLILSAAILLLTFISLLAAFAPARTAVSIDPIQAIRSE